jgi:phospholipid/cholesterol/gamma-HCH transport system substrate-binding protein
MKKTNTDLIVGGTIFAALFIMIASVLWLKELSVASRRVHYSVLFSNIGLLQLGDPVTVSGLKSGRVLDVKMLQDSVAVTMELDKNIMLTDSARITVQNIGLMGERCVGIQLSKKGARCRPDANGRPPAYIHGYFDSGIGEAMGMIGTVLADVRVLLTNVQGIINKTVGDTVFIDVFQKVVCRLDTLSGMAQTLVKRDAPKVDRAVSDLSALAGQMQQLVDANKKDLDRLIKNGAQLSDQALVITGNLDTLTTSLNGMIADIKSGKGSIGKLMQDENLYSSLKGSIQALDTLVKDVQDEGLKLRIKLGFKKGKR